MTENAPDNESQDSIHSDDEASFDEKVQNEDSEVPSDPDEAEFSLEQLSAAYAQVLKNRPESAVVDNNPQLNLPPDAESIQTADHHSVDDRGPDDAKPNVARKQDPDVDDNAACPVSPSSILESILFVGGPKDVKLNSRKIAAVMRDVSPQEITALAKALNKSYEQEKRAYRIVSEKGSLRMELHPDMIPLQNHILGRDRATKLTQQAIDVLAIVAYNQPCPREQVDQIRAKPSSSILNQMLKRNLLQLEVTESLPTQKLFRTTDRFLDLFGLETIQDLPESHDVSDIDELAD